MKNNSFINIDQRKVLIIEAVSWVIAVAFLLCTMRSLFLYGTSTFMHDNILWGYPTFQFFADSIVNGHYPFWNPFSHGGEPFYPIIIQRMFLDPLTLLVIYIGHFITSDILIIFNWFCFAQWMIMVSGSYFVFRPLAGNLFIRLTLIPILLYSSFIIVSLRQGGLLNLFLWLPYITFFMFRIVYYKDYRWHNWLIFAVLVGLHWQSYFFSGIWVFLLFIFMGFILFRRDLLRELFMARKNILKLVVISFVVLLMMVPNVVVLLEKDNLVVNTRKISSDIKGRLSAPPAYENGPAHARDISVGMVMPYKFISYTGGPSTIWDFIMVISPGTNHYGQFDIKPWGAPCSPTESFIYVGLVPWAIALLGIVVGVHNLKKVWMVVFFGIGILILGPAGGLHRLLYYIWPPLWFIRHTSLFVLFFVFSLIYFYVIGFNHIFSTWGGRIFPGNTAKCIPNRFLAGSSSESVCVNNNYMLWINNNPRFIRTLSFRLTRIINFMRYLLVFRLRRYCINAIYRYVDFGFVWKACTHSNQLFIRCGEGFNRLWYYLRAWTYTWGFLFALIIYFIIYKMAFLIHPQTNYLFCYIIIIIGVWWLLRKRFGRKEIYICLIVSHIAIVLTFNPNTYKFLIHYVILFGIPLALFLFLKAYPDKIKKRYAVVIMLAVFTASLCVDLVYNLRKCEYSYTNQKHPGLIRHNIRTDIQKPFLPQKRFLSPEQVDSTTGQSIRYLSLLYQQPFVFSTLYDLENKPDSFEYALKSKRWNSFFVPQKYFDLIHSGISPLAMKKMFAVDEPMFQYKRGAVLSDDKDAFDLLKQLGADKSIELLRDYVLLDKSYKQTLSGAGIPVIDNRNISQSIYTMQSDSGRRHDNEGNDMSYTINNYGHNSFDMNVSVDEPGVLYWSDGYDKWWRAYVNGEEVPLYRANVNFKSVVLPKGDNNIRFVYSPDLFKTALFVFYGVFIVSIVAAALIRIVENIRFAGRNSC